MLKVDKRDGAFKHNLWQSLEANPGPVFSGQEICVPRDSHCAALNLCVSLCRRSVWTVPGSSPGARPVPGVGTSPAQTPGNPQRPDGSRWGSFIATPVFIFWKADREEVDIFVAPSQVWPGGTTSPRRSLAESWVTFLLSALPPNFMRSRPDSKKTHSFSTQQSRTTQSSEKNRKI